MILQLDATLYQRSDGCPLGEHIDDEHTKQKSQEGNNHSFSNEAQPQTSQ